MLVLFVLLAAVGIDYGVTFVGAVQFVPADLPVAAQPEMVRLLHSHFCRAGFFSTIAPNGVDGTVVVESPALRASCPGHSFVFVRFSTLPRPWTAVMRKPLGIAVGPAAAGPWWALCAIPHTGQAGWIVDGHGIGASFSDGIRKLVESVDFRVETEADIDRFRGLMADVYRLRGGRVVEVVSVADYADGLKNGANAQVSELVWQLELPHGKIGQLELKANGKIKSYKMIKK